MNPILSPKKCGIGIVGSAMIFMALWFGFRDETTEVCVLTGQTRTRTLIARIAVAETRNESWISRIAAVGGDRRDWRPIAAVSHRLTGITTTDMELGRRYADMRVALSALAEAGADDNTLEAKARRLLAEAAAAQSRFGIQP